MNKYIFDPNQNDLVDCSYCRNHKADFRIIRLMPKSDSKSFYDLRNKIELCNQCLESRYY